MKCKIVSISHKPSDWEKKALDFYSKQLPKNLVLTFSEVKPFASKSMSEGAIKDAESKEILKQLEDSSYVILCDREGKQFSSLQFANFIQESVDQSRDLTLIVGGAFGVSDALFARAHMVLSASLLTFPHRLFKIMLIEQIYRACAINSNHPYHK